MSGSAVRRWHPFEVQANTIYHIFVHLCSSYELLSHPKYKQVWVRSVIPHAALLRNDPNMASVKRIKQDANLSQWSAADIRLDPPTSAHIRGCSHWASFVTGFRSTII